MAEVGNVGQDRNIALDPVVVEAKKRFERCVKWESDARKLFLDDLKFAEADSDNAFQWPNAIRRNRDSDERPCLTINKTRIHNLQIINDMKQNKPGLVARPVGNGATFESAQVLTGIFRHVEYQSNASTAYDTAASFQVRSGWGWIRLARDYPGDDTFDQEIYIRRVIDPLSIYNDPEAKEVDKSDMKFLFVFDDINKDEFDEAYPEYKGWAAQNALGNVEGEWITRDHVRICEYFRKVEVKDELVAINGSDGELKIIKKSQLPKEIWAEIDDDPMVRRRQIYTTKVERYLIIGEKIAEKTEEPGKYIPFSPAIGEETIIDGTMDRKGHTRALKDPQRMYNYHSPLSLATPLPTPTGWTTMGQIQVGQQLFDEMGKIVTVAGLSPIYCDRLCYEVRFTDGTKITADADHEWVVEERGKRTSATFTWNMKTISTKELIPGKHFIYSTKPLDLAEDSELPLHPYLFGAWLGDGDTNTPRISTHRDDAEEMQTNITACGYTVGDARFASNNNGAVFGVLGLTKIFRDHAYFGDKHIPIQYLRASKEQRLALLQGLMDTDGHIRPNNQCVFVNTNQDILNGFTELLQTLGIKPSVNEFAGTARVFPNGKTYQTKDSYSISFTADPDMQVFRLTRKRAIQERDRPLHPRRTKRVGIESILPVPSVPVRCVGIASESHLFLAGRGMVPTHNSAAVEYIALQSKTPYIAAAQAIEEYEGYWNTANKVNHSVLVYNAYDDLGNVIPAPTRQEPPAASQGYLAAMQTAANEMMMVSGQYQPMMGEPSNERSGKALSERQRQGDNATYHYIDGMAICLRHVAKIILDWIPYVYDTKRVMKILANNDEPIDLQIDPQAKAAFAQELNGEQEVVRRIFNPNVGKYDVQAEIGPAYGTRREQAFDAYITLMTQAPEIASVIADLLMQNADFPTADEAARRLKLMVPKQALGQGPSQAEQALQQQLAQVQELLQHSMDELASNKLKLIGKGEMRDIDAYDSETKRLAVLAKLGIDQTSLKVTIAQLMHDMAKTPLDFLVQQNQAGPDGSGQLGGAGGEGAEGGQSPSLVPNNGPSPEPPPFPDARKAPDGEWYIPDPHRPGKYARVLRTPAHA